MNQNDLARQWTERAELLEDAAFAGQKMPDSLSYPEQLLFLRFRYLYAYAKLVQMPPEQGKAEKQEILTSYIAHCAEQLIYAQATKQVAG